MSSVRNPDSQVNVRADVPIAAMPALVLAARSRGLTLAGLVRLALTETTGLAVATSRDRAKIAAAAVTPLIAAPPVDAPVTRQKPTRRSGKVALMTPMSEAMAEQITAVARDRGTTKSALIRYSLTTVLGIPVAGPTDYPAGERDQLVIEASESSPAPRKRRAA